MVSKTALRSVPFTPRAKLPRGPHALPPDVVIAQQRERLLSAAINATASFGLADLTVRDLIEGAGVSRRTFYQLFNSKLECVIAAHRQALERFVNLMIGACSAESAWPDGVAAAVNAGLEFAARSPSEARLLLLSCHTVSEPMLRDAAQEAQERFAAMLRVGRKLCPDARALPELTEPALVGAVSAIVGAHLCTRDVEGLRRLAPEITQIILAPYVGRSEAQRATEAAA